MQIYINRIMKFRNFYHSLIILLLLSQLKAYSQNDSLTFKNEIGINTGSLAIIALGSNSPMSQPLEINYRRNIKKNFFIRTYFHHKEIYPKNRGNIFQYFEVLDSNQIKTHFMSIERWSRSFAVGLEYRSKINNWGVIYGINLKYVYYRNQIFHYYNLLNYNNNLLINPYLNNNITNYTKGHLDYDVTFGIEPNIGLFFNINKRLTFIAQSRIYMGYGKQTYYYQDYNTWQANKNIFNILRFDSQPLISELSINYKF